MKNKKTKKMAKSISTYKDCKGIKPNPGELTARKKSIHIKSFKKPRKSIKRGWLSSPKYNKGGQNIDRGRLTLDLEGIGSSTRKFKSQERDELLKLKESLLSERVIDDRPSPLPLRNNGVFQSFKKQSSNNITLIDEEQQNKEQKYDNQLEMGEGNKEILLTNIEDQNGSEILDESSILRRSFLKSSSKRADNKLFNHESRKNGKQNRHSPLKIKLKVKNQKIIRMKSPPNIVASRNQLEKINLKSGLKFDFKTNNRQEARVRDANEEDLKRVGLFTKMLSNKSLDLWSTNG